MTSFWPRLLGIKSGLLPMTLSVAPTVGITDHSEEDTGFFSWAVATELYPGSILGRTIRIFWVEFLPASPGSLTSGQSLYLCASVSSLISVGTSEKRGGGVK